MLTMLMAPTSSASFGCYCFLSASEVSHGEFLQHLTSDKYMQNCSPNAVEDACNLFLQELKMSTLRRSADLCSVRREVAALTTHEMLSMSSMLQRFQATKICRNGHLLG